MQYNEFIENANIDCLYIGFKVFDKNTIKKQDIHIKAIYHYVNLNIKYKHDKTPTHIFFVINYNGIWKVLELYENKCLFDFNDYLKKVNVNNLEFYKFNNEIEGSNGEISIQCKKALINSQSGEYKFKKIKNINKYNALFQYPVIKALSSLNDNKIIDWIRDLDIFVFENTLNKILNKKFFNKIKPCVIYLHLDLKNLIYRGYFDCKEYKNKFNNENDYEIKITSLYQFFKFYKV